MRYLVAGLIIAALAIACGNSDAPAVGAGGGGNAAMAGSGGSGGSGAVAGASTSAALHGGVVVSLNEPTDADGYTTLIGRFFDGPQPQAIPLALDTEDGECALYVPKLPFCNEPCSPAVCTADDVCTLHPKPLGVGTLTVNGLGTPLALEASGSMSAYQSPSLAYPPCEAGGTVSASASELSLEAECIAPLELTGPDPIPVLAGKAVKLTWKAAAASAGSRVRIKLDVSHHGGSKGEIDCEVADTGAFDIPAPLVTKLVGLGLAGFPTINLNRVALGSDANHPDVTLLLSSDVTRAVDTGVDSCLDASECASGMCLDGGTCA